MKRLTILFVAAIYLTTSAASSFWAGGAGTTAVTSAATGAFPSGTVFNGVTLTGSQVGNGVVIYADGSASGDFWTVLIGTSALGDQLITISGLVSSGTLNPDGSATFGGSGVLDMGDGTPVQPLPFSVTATPQGLTLVLGATTLPTQVLTSGGIEIGPF